MSNWSRDKDAWIATHCDGLKVSRTTAHCEYVYEQHNGRYEAVATYLTDPTAAIRAAEAWRKKVQGREVRLEWRENDVTAGLGDKQAGWHQWYEPCDQPAAALAQALYRATGGPA